MSDPVFALVVVVLAVALLALCIYLLAITGIEFERKLGRSLSTGEAVFAVFAVAFSGSGWLAIIYVWLIMPEPKAKP